LAGTAEGAPSRVSSNTPAEPHHHALDGGALLVRRALELRAERAQCPVMIFIRRRSTSCAPYLRSDASCVSGKSRSLLLHAGRARMWLSTGSSTWQRISCIPDEVPLLKASHLLPMLDPHEMPAPIEMQPA
jgi:hypothetical protein